MVVLTGPIHFVNLDGFLGHVTGSPVHPLIIFSVNFMAQLVRNVIFPPIFYHDSHLISHFSPYFKINVSDLRSHA